MRRTIFVATFLCCLFVLSVRECSAQERKPTPDPPARNQPNSEPVITGNNSSDSSDTEVEALRRRIDAVEKQNRDLLQVLADLRARIEKSGQSEETNSAQNTRNVQKLSAPAASIEAPVGAKKNDETVVHWSDLLREGNRIKLYGFLRLDMLFDSQRPNNAQTILFINSPDPRTGNTNNGDFTMHPRLTRFGIDYTGPSINKLADAKLSGKVEVDFQNGGSESRQVIRIRHGFLKLNWKDISVLAGQTWDIVSPLFPTVNNDTLQWNAGNVGDRRPQLRLAYESALSEKAKLSLTGGIGLTGAIDSLDLDANGTRDGEESSRPNMQGRIGFSYPSTAQDQRASFGLSGFYGTLKTSRAVAGRTSFNSQLINIDFTLPMHARLTLRGEGWWGRNLSDVRGGVGQGINTANGREIRGRGGWAETNIKFSRYFVMSPGFSTDDPVDADIPVNGRTRNHVVFIANRITPNENLLFGIDYFWWRTNYKGLLNGTNNRVNIFLQYNF